MNFLNVVCKKSYMYAYLCMYIYVYMYISSAAKGVHNPKSKNCGLKCFFSHAATKCRSLFLYTFQLGIFSQKLEELHIGIWGTLGQKIKVKKCLIFVPSCHLSVINHLHSGCILFCIFIHVWVKRKFG